VYLPKIVISCPGRGLLYPRVSDMHLSGFSDADWATCLNTRRSITRYCYF